MFGDSRSGCRGMEVSVDASIAPCDDLREISESDPSASRARGPLSLGVPLIWTNRDGSRSLRSLGACSFRAWKACRISPCCEAMFAKFS
jgi:hypothetical protein